MDDPLWTDAHAPDLDAIPQDQARRYFQRALTQQLNLVVHGPQGCGKSAAVRAMARKAHADPDNDLIELNVADFFDRTKTEIRNDPRFSEFLQGEVPWVRQLGQDEKRSVSKRYKSDWSKAEMISHVLKEFASYKPTGSEYKTLVLDNAETVREDFQQSLRRAMERFHRTTQFVIITRQPTKLILPIRSRCFPIPMRSPTQAEIVEVLSGIVDAEPVEYDREGLEYVAGYAGGDLRRAILAAQTIHATTGAITMQTAYETLTDIGLADRVEEMMVAAETGEFGNARSILDDLLVDEGLTGEEVLDELLRVARKRYAGDRLARVHRRAGEIDMDIHEGTNDRLHLAHLLADLGADRIPVDRGQTSMK